MAHSRVRAAAILTVVAVFACTAPALAKKGPPVAELTNNLSFPAVAADGFAIATPPTPNPTLTTVYDTDPTTPEIEPFLLDGLPCYAQKATGNVWQASRATATTIVGVFGVDWGDNVDSVLPMVREAVPARARTLRPGGRLDGDRPGWSSPERLQHDRPRQSELSRRGSRAPTAPGTTAPTRRSSLERLTLDS